jgi:Tol biopolymer transport system component
MDLYFESPLSIEVWDRSGNQRIRITEGESSDSSPMLTADGKSIFFLSDRDGEVDLYRAEVKEGADVERLDALAATGVEAIAGTAGGPQISGDGRWLVFVGALGGQRKGAFLVDTQAQEVSRLDSGEGSVENVSISHDGSTLSWTAGCTPTCSGWIRPTVGGTPHLVVEDVFLTSPLALSPDGSQIAYLSNEGVLLVMRGDGSDPRVVTSADEERNIATVMLFHLGFY